MWTEIEWKERQTYCERNVPEMLAVTLLLEKCHGPIHESQAPEVIKTFQLILMGLTDYHREASELRSRVQMLEAMLKAKAPHATSSESGATSPPEA